MLAAYRNTVRISQWGEFPYKPNKRNSKIFGFLTGFFSAWRSIGVLCCEYGNSRDSYDEETSQTLSEANPAFKYLNKLSRIMSAGGISQYSTSTLFGFTCRQLAGLLLRGMNGTKKKMEHSYHLFLVFGPSLFLVPHDF